MSKIVSYKDVKSKKKTQEELSRGGFFPSHMYNYKTVRIPITEALERLKCKPYVSKKEYNLLIKRDNIYKRKERAEKEIEKIDELLKLSTARQDTFLKNLKF